MALQRVWWQKVEYMLRCPELTYLFQRRSASSKRDRKPATFSALLAERRLQAQRSVLIGYNGSNLPRALQACQRHGHLEAISLFHQEDKNYALVEMNSAAAVESLLDHSIFSRDFRHFPLRSRMLTLSSVGPRSSRRYKPPGNVPVYQERHISDVQIYQSLSSKPDLSSQMRELHLQLRLDEAPRRLRHISCQIVEDALQRLCPTVSMVPYGSAVNGFGRYDCDVDMMIDLYGQVTNREPPSGLQFTSKARMEDQRADTQQVLETFARFLKQFVPHHYHIQWVLRARIPIIKFQQKCTGLDCDLALGNESGVYMSDLLHLYGELDSRVRPLVCTIRSWARSQNVTLPGHPNQHLTNFMVTLLVLFFLQRRPEPVLPTLRNLQELADPADLRKFDGGSCHFVTQWSRVPKSSNTESLGSLLSEFFQFYHQMDFSAGCLSLISGQLEPLTSDPCPVYLKNPLEPELNASRNVGSNELAQFQVLCGEACRVLNGDDDKPKLRFLVDPSLAGSLSSDVQVSMGGIFSDNKETSGEASDQSTDNALKSDHMVECSSETSEDMFRENRKHADDNSSR